MPDDIRRIDYYYTSVPDKPGEGARVLATLQGADINRRERQTLSRNHKPSASNWGEE